MQHVEPTTSVTTRPLAALLSSYYIPSAHCPPKTIASTRRLDSARVVCVVACAKNDPISSTLEIRRNFIQHPTKSSNGSLERAFFALWGSVNGFCIKFMNFLLRPIGNRVFDSCHSAQKRNFPSGPQFGLRFQIEHVQLYLFHIFRYRSSPPIPFFSCLLKTS